MTNYPFFLWDNHLATGTTVASSEASGYPDENLYDWRWGQPYRWRSNTLIGPLFISIDLGSGVALYADTLVIAGHNLKAAGVTTLKVMYSDDDATYYDSAGTTNPQNWLDDYPISIIFASPGAHRYWRIYIGKTGNFDAYPEIAIATLGRRLEFIDSFPPDLDLWGERADCEYNDAMNGQFLGCNLNFVRKEFEILLPEMGFTTTEFFKRSSGPNFDDSLRVHLRSNPFWFADDLETEPYHVFLCQAREGYTSPIWGLRTRRTLSMPVVAYVPV